MNEFQSYKRNIIEACSPSNAMSLVFVGGNVMDGVKAFLRELKNADAELWVYGYRQGWLDLGTNVAINNIPEWARMLERTVEGDGNHKLPIDVLLSKDFESFFRRDAFDIRDAEGKRIWPEPFGFLGVRVDVERLSLESLREYVPSAMPTRGRIGVAKKHQILKAFVNQKQPLLNVVFEEYGTYFKAPTKVLLSFLDMLMPNEWLARHREVCVKSYLL